MGYDSEIVVKLARWQRSAMGHGASLAVLNITCFAFVRPKVMKHKAISVLVCTVNDLRWTVFCKNIASF